MLTTMASSASTSEKERSAPAPVSASSTGGPIRRFRRQLCLDDFETAACKHLPRPVFGYVAGAAETNSSHDDNRSAFREFGFLPRVLVAVSTRSQETTLFGRTYSAP